MSAADRIGELELETLEVQLADSLLTVAVHRPEVLNALSPQVIAELRLVFGELLSSLGRPLAEGGEELDWSIRGVILTGTGGKAFIAGADIWAMRAMSSDEARTYTVETHELFVWIESLAVPVIAAVNGYALGGGCEIALACDFIYAAESAKFGQPEVALGIIPGFGGCVRLQQRVGAALARELIFTGRHVEALEAMRIGLASRVLPDSGALMTAARETLELAARQSPAAVATAKRTIRATQGMTTEQGLAVETDAFVSCIGTPDMLEGTSAFLEKRRPEFPGR